MSVGIVTGFQPYKPEALSSRRALLDTYDYIPDGVSPAYSGKKWPAKINAYISAPDYSDPEAVPIIVLLGYGEGLSAAEAACNQASEMTGATVFVPDLRYDFSSDRDELEQSVLGTFLATVKRVNSLLGRAENAAVDVITHSQGGAVLAKSIQDLQQKQGDNFVDPVRFLEEISPAGFNNSSLGASPQTKRWNFIVRLALKNNARADQSLMFNLPFGRFRRDGEKGYIKNLTLAKSVGLLALSDIVGRRFAKKLDIAFGLDSQKPAEYIKQRLADGKPTGFYAAENDPVFPPTEYEQTFGNDSGLIERLEGASHSGVITPGGQAQLANAIYHLLDAREPLSKR